MASIDWLRAIPRFIQDEKLIRSDKTLGLVTFPDLVFGLAYLGGGNLFLGAAVVGWKEGHLTTKCPNCGAKTFITSAGGSPLSGAGGWSGYCENCGRVRKEQTVTGLVHHPKIKGRWASLGYQPILQEGSPWKFDFNDGAYREGDLEEIRLPVLGWETFIKEYYPDLLAPDPKVPSTQEPSPQFGMSIRGKMFITGGGSE